MVILQILSSLVLRTFIIQQRLSLFQKLAASLIPKIIAHVGKNGKSTTSSNNSMLLCTQAFAGYQLLCQFQAKRNQWAYASNIFTFHGIFHGLRSEQWYSEWITCVLCDLLPSMTGAPFPNDWLLIRPLLDYWEAFWDHYSTIRNPKAIIRSSPFFPSRNPCGWDSEVRPCSIVNPLLRFSSHVWDYSMDSTSWKA